MTKRHDPTRRTRLADASLYWVLDPRPFGNGEAIALIEATLAAGVDVVQLRMKGAPTEQIVGWGEHLEPICRNLGVLLIINDDVVAARECGADGVHLGQGDGSLGEARQLLSAHHLIGRSTHSLDQALAAEAEGADCIGIGSMFPTATKERPLLIGPSLLPAVVARLTIPIFPIGGIHAENLDQIVAAGCRRAAVSAALSSAPNPPEVARDFKRRLLLR